MPDWGAVENEWKKKYGNSPRNLIILIVQMIYYNQWGDRFNFFFFFINQINCNCHNMIIGTLTGVAIPFSSFTVWLNYGFEFRFNGNI